MSSPGIARAGTPRAASMGSPIIRNKKKITMDAVGPTGAFSPRGKNVSVSGKRSRSNSDAHKEGIDQQLATLLRNLDLDGDEKVTIKEFRLPLSSTGLHPHVVNQAIKIVDEDNDGNITFEEIMKLRTESHNWILNALLNDLAIRDYTAFTEILDECYEAALNETNVEDTFIDDCCGDLTEEEEEAFAAAFCSVDGQHWVKGSSKRWTLQGCSYPIMYCLAIEKVGPQTVHTIVGQEPRGQGSTEYRMDKNGKPHNPMITLGAIATASLVEPEKDLADRFQEFVHVTQRLTGKEQMEGGNDDKEEITFNNFCYLKTSEGAVREYSLAYSAKENNAFPNVESHDDLTNLLRFHFMTESLELNVSQLSIVAATLARGGINPITRKRVFASETVQNCLSVLFTCGLKDLTGGFAFEIGLPAKCGRSGLMMVVVPGVGGFATHSPLMRENEDVSCKGINFCYQLIKRLPFHIFDPESAKLDQVDSEYADVYQLIYSAANGDLASVSRFVVHQELDVNSTDYDKRTPLHLAVAERRIVVVKFLLEQGAEVDCKDRFGKTPLDETKGDSALYDLLKSYYPTEHVPEYQEAEKKAPEKKTPPLTSPPTTHSDSLYSKKNSSNSKRLSNIPTTFDEFLC